MAHSIVIKLNKPANEFSAGDSVGFGVRGGVQYYDHKTKQKEWTNYSAVVFAKAQAQIDFYRSALVEGAVIEVGGKNQKVDVYNGANGASYTIELLDAWLGRIDTPTKQQAYQQQPQQQAYAAPQQQYAQPQQYAQQQQPPQQQAVSPQGQPYNQGFAQPQQQQQYPEGDIPFNHG